MTTKAEAVWRASVAEPGSPREAAEAFARMRPEMLAVDGDEVSPAQVDIPRAVAVAIGAIPHLRQLRPHIAAELPSFPLRNVDELGTYALGAWYAYLIAVPKAPESAVAGLVKEASGLREDLLVAAEALAHKGYFNRDTVTAIRAGADDLEKANDLVALAALFSREWRKVQQKTTVEWREVERAAEVGPQILMALGEPEPPGSGGNDGLDMNERRARARVIFVRAYEECRRAVTYLRWYEGDADEIMPPLGPVPAGRRSSATEADAGGCGGPAPTWGRRGGGARSWEP